MELFCPAGANTGVPATPEEAETGLAPGARPPAGGMIAPGLQCPTGDEGGTGGGGGRGSPVCWTCSQRGHISRDCPAKG